MTSSCLWQPFLSILLLVTGIGTAQADGTLPAPHHLTIADGMSRSTEDALLLPARRYYAFWQTGEAHYAQQALAADFTDLNLPAGRPQRPTWPPRPPARVPQALPSLSGTTHGTFVVGGHGLSP